MTDMSLASCVEISREDAEKFLRVPLGGHEKDDVVGELLLNLFERGKSKDEVLELLNKSRVRHKMLEYTKNSIYRRETAAKRGGETPPTSLESVVHVASTSEADTPEALVIRKEKRQSDRTLLDKIFADANLSKTEKEILTLTASGYKPQEIADELNIRLSTVYTRRSDARRKLRTALYGLREDRINE